MTRNRFHKILVAAVASIALALPAQVSGALPKTQAAEAAGGQVATLIFEPGSLRLSAENKTKLAAKLEQMRLSPAVFITGFAGAGTKKNRVTHDSLARATAIKTYLESLGLTVLVNIKSGGYSSRFVSAKVADRATVSFAPTPGLLFAEDFNGPAGATPSARDFTGLTGDGCQELGLCTYGTGEIEINDPSAAKTDGRGNLVIHTSKLNGTWTSERLWTAQKLAFEYGQLEIRAKLPAGSFNWPAIWMLGNDYSPPNNAFGSTQWPASGELDITEGLGSNSVVQGTLHGLDSNTGGDWNGGAGLTAVAPLGDLTSAFHTWGIRWLPNLVIFTLDGKEYCRDSFDGAKVNQTFANGSLVVFDSHKNWPFNQPFFLILNNAVPAGTSAPEGTQSDFKIDYIHYSSFNGFGQVIR